MKTLSIRSISTPLGTMHAGATSKGICLLEYDDPEHMNISLSAFKDFSIVEADANHPLLNQLEEELFAYFEKQRTEFSLPLDFIGTKFQKSVWQALLKVPFGQTRTYLEQSKVLGDPKAIRAVANANGQNRIAIVVPCHRIIGSDGSLTGYAGQLWRKRFLLELESTQQSLF